MELSNLKLCEQIVDLIHPLTGDELNIKVSILPLSDERLVKVKRALLNKRLMLERRGKSFTAEELENYENDLLCSAVTGWIWNPEIKFHNSVPEFSIDTLKQIFKELPWFKEQIQEFLQDEKNFFQK